MIHVDGTEYVCSLMMKAVKLQNGLSSNEANKLEMGFGLPRPAVNKRLTRL